MYYGSDKACGVLGGLTENGMVSFVVKLKKEMDMKEDEPDGI